MKIITLFLFLGIFSLHAESVHSQDAKINIDNKDILVEQVINEIEKQTNYLFVYNDEIEMKRKTSIRAENSPVSQVLEDLFKETDIVYAMKGSHIILTKRIDSNLSIGQKNEKTEGVVIDNSGQALIGVSVSIKGTTQGTLTDVDGKFSLNIEAGKTLVVSYVGYNTLEIVVKDDAPLKITLKESDIALETVIVTALGIKRSEKALSYNAEVVGADAVNQVKDGNFINALTGKVAGVNINASSSGTGGASKVIIRGQKSIEGNNNVLYVIDGVPMLNSIGASDDDREGVYGMQPTGGDGIGDINPDDIENMTILKGPAAAALYGSSASNGAILVTTKRGQAGQLKVTYTNQSTFSKPFLMPKFQNTYGNNPEEFSSWGAKLNNPSNFDPKEFFNTGSNIQNTLSLSTGSERNQTYISVATTNSDGIISNNEYNRYNFTVRNTTQFLNDKMTLDIGANYITQNNQNMTAQGQYFNPLLPLYLFPRGEDFDDIRMYKEYNSGQMHDEQRWDWEHQGLSLQNPYWVTEKNSFQTKRNRYMLNAGLSYEIFDWLSASGRVRIDNTNNKETIKLNAGTLRQLSGANGNYGRNESKQKHTYADFIVNFNKYFSDFSVSAHAGTIFEDQRFELTGLRGDLVMPDFFALRNINKAHDATRVKEEQWAHQTHSVFASAEIGWKSMVYLTATARNEWDTALARMPSKSYFYPSIGVSAVISQMVELPEFVNYLKVRSSYADVGSSIPRNISMLYYRYNEQQDGWANKTHMPIDKLYPEKTTSWEVGFDTKFWKNRFDLSVTLYKSNTKKQTITGIEVSPTSKYESIIIQTGNVENRGMEIALGYQQKWNDFSWSSNFSASVNLNKIKSLGNYYNENGELTSLDQLTPTSVGTTKVILKEGGTIGDLWTTTRLRKDQNGYIYVDGGKVMSEEHLQKVGSLLPRWNLGLNNSFSWKDIHMGFVITGRIGGKVLSMTQSIMDSYGVSEATAIARDNGGIPVNYGVIDAETWYKTTSGIHSHYIYSATNIRLQEASIGYTLPRKWFANKLKITTSLVGRNLLMIYNKAPFDPEAVASTGNYYQGIDYFMVPSLRSFGFSVKVEL